MRMMRIQIAAMFILASLALSAHAESSVGYGSPAQLNPQSQSNYVTQLANVSAIFGAGSITGLNITRVTTGPDRFVEIMNQGTAPVSMGDWRLVNSQEIVYVFPSDFTLAPGATVRVHDDLGMDNSTDLYINSVTSFLNPESDTVTLTDERGARKARYSYPGSVSAPKSNGVTGPALINTSSPGMAGQSAVGPALISPNQNQG